MKKITILFIFLLGALLTACGGTTQTSTTAKITLSSLTTTTTTISFKLRLTDADNQILPDSTTIELSVDGTVVDQLKNQNIPKTQTKLFVFENLERSTKHVIKIFAQTEDGEITLWHNPDSPTETKGHGESVEDPISISTTEEFLEMKNTLFYVLENDLDFEGASIDPIFKSASAFSGGLDGAGYSIKNISISDSTHVNRQYVSILGYVSTAQIRNITFDGITIDNTAKNYSGTSYVGIIASRVTRDEFILENVTIKNSNIIFTHNEASSSIARNLYMGLAIGSAKGTVTDLTIESSEINLTQKALNGTFDGADILVAGSYVGGAIGLFEHDSGEKIQNIQVDATVNITFTQKYQGRGNGLLYVGGLIGAYRSDINISSVFADVDINLDYTKHEDTEADKLDSVYLGGLFGFLHKANAYDGYYQGEITANFSDPIKDVYIAALVGYAQISSSRLSADASITISTENETQNRIVTSFYNYMVTQSLWNPADHLKVFQLMIEIDQQQQDLSQYTTLSASEFTTYFQSEWLIDLLT